MSYVRPIKRKRRPIERVSKAEEIGLRGRSALTGEPTPQAVGSAPRPAAHVVQRRLAAAVVR